MKILLIDNYDSFTFNIYQYIGEILSANKTNFQIDIKRNNDITLTQVEKENYDRIIISPGPGDPSIHAYFGICSDVIITLGKKIPVFGICLGMQGIAYNFGAKIIKAKKPMHGKASIIKHDGKGVFLNVPQEISVMRYHSLIVDKSTLPENVIITAEVIETGEIMGLRHNTLPIEGVQFHPESFATEGGKLLLENFLTQL